jgi:hypothetical protein
MRRTLDDEAVANAHRRIRHRKLRTLVCISLAHIAASYGIVALNVLLTLAVKGRFDIPPAWVFAPLWTPIVLPGMRAK